MTPQERHKIQKRIFIFGLITWTILLAGYGYAKYLSWQNSNAENVASQKAQDDIQALQTKRESTMADWKIYTNVQYGFNFKYPPNLFDRSDKNTIRLSSSQITIYDGGGARPDGIEGKDWVKGYEIFVTPDDSISFNLLSKDGYEPKRLNYTQIEAYQFTGVDIPSSGRDVLIKNPNIKDSYVDIGYNNGLGDYATVDKIFNQILSTFKFTDATGQFCGGIATGAFLCPTGYSCKLDGSYPDAGGKCIPTSASTADWKIYTNIQYGFSFTYPNSWSLNELSNQKPDQQGMTPVLQLKIDGPHHDDKDCDLVGGCDYPIEDYNYASIQISVADSVNSEVKKFTTAEGTKEQGYDTFSASGFSGYAFIPPGSNIEEISAYRTLPNGKVLLLYWVRANDFHDNDLSYQKYLLPILATLKFTK